MVASAFSAPAPGLSRPEPIEVVVGAEYAARCDMALFPRILVERVTTGRQRCAHVLVLAGEFRGERTLLATDGWAALYAQIDPLPEVAIDRTVDRVFRELVSAR